MASRSNIKPAAPTAAAQETTPPQNLRGIQIGAALVGVVLIVLGVVLANSAPEIGIIIVVIGYIGVALLLISAVLTFFGPNMRALSIGFALIGFGAASYLVWAKVTGGETACVKGASDCGLVQNSQWSTVAGIPVAYIGWLGYAAILGVLLLENRITLLAQRGKLLVFGMTVIGFLFSAYLSAIEAFTLHAWCQWCVISALSMTILCGLSFARVWRAISAVPDEIDETEA